MAEKEVKKIIVIKQNLIALIIYQDKINAKLGDCKKAYYIKFIP